MVGVLNGNYVARARPRPRPKSKTTQNNVQQTSCNLTSMQAQLSELQKILCKISEASNVNKGRVEQYTVVSNLSDSKGLRRNITKGHKKRSQRRKHLKTSLTYNTRAKNEKYIKNFSNKALSDDKVKLLSRGLKLIPTPPIPSPNKSFLKDFKKNG